jgi:hypothetical protein
VEKELPPCLFSIEGQGEDKRSQGRDYYKGYIEKSGLLVYKRVTEEFEENYRHGKVKNQNLRN